MANSIVGAIPLYIDRTKVGEATEGSYEIDNGVERVVTNDGTVFQHGKVTTTITFKTIVPRAGMKSRLMEAVVQKKDVVAQMPLDGKFHEIEGKLKTGKVDWNHASGSCMGDVANSLNLIPYGSPVVGEYASNIDDHVELERDTR